MKYLKHSDVLAVQEIKRIIDSCTHYTELFTETNEYFKKIIQIV